MTDTNELQRQLDQLLCNGRIDSLAISHNGFVFDPVSGQSFTANETALALLQCLQRTQRVCDVVASMDKMFHVEQSQCLRALSRFIQQLQRALP